MISEAALAKAGYSLVVLTGVGVGALVVQAVALDRDGMPTVATIVFSFAAVCALAALGVLVKLFVQSIETAKLPPAVDKLGQKISAHVTAFDKHVLDEQEKWGSARADMKASADRVQLALSNAQNHMDEQVELIRKELPKRRKRA